MKVRELIDELEKYDENQAVIVCNFIYDDNMEIIDLQYFDPDVHVWDDSIPDNDPENIISISPGKLISE